MKKMILGLAVLVIFNSCEELAVEREDVVRFDYSVSANEDAFVLSNTVIEPYETEELEDYKDERDQIKEFEITKIEFRYHTFRVDHDSTLIMGTADITSSAGTTFEMELFDVGNEYKDSENHELHKLLVNGAEEADKYNTLSQELVDADSFTINMSNLSGVVDSLDCELSIYFHYRIKAPL